MTPEQEKFFYYVEKRAPFLLGLWDWEAREILPEKVEQYLASASHGEQVLARFFAAVWLHRNHFDFDFLEAVKTLDLRNREIITDWMHEPIWP